MKAPKDIQLLSTNSIRPFPQYHKLLPPLRRIIAKIKASIEKEGFRKEEPIVIWWDTEDNAHYILDGHQRYLAAVALNLPEVWVAIAIFETRQEAIDYMIARQVERRNIERATILNALLNAHLYARGGARKHNNPAPEGSLQNGQSSKPISQQEIADALDVCLRTISRHKRDYLDEMTSFEKDLFASGGMDIEDVIAAVDERRKKPKQQSKIVRLLSKIDFSEAEIEQWIALAEAKGTAPCVLVAMVLRSALEENLSHEHCPALTSTAPPSKPEPRPAEGIVAGSSVGNVGTNESQGSPPTGKTENDPPKQNGPVAVPNDSAPTPIEAVTAVVSTGSKPAAATPALAPSGKVEVDDSPGKEKDWKQWHQCQKDVLWHLYVSNGQKSQAGTASVYFEFEQELLGEKCHSRKAVEHEISHLVKQFSNSIISALSPAELEAAVKQIKNIADK